MTAKHDPYAVVPNSVYVWRGFKAAATNYDDFAKFLGTVFVPACALLQPAVGLRAYLPTMVPQANKPAAVPDQTALMFWATPKSHDLAAQAIAVRIYQNLHGDAYDMVRSKLQEVPVALPSPGPMQAEQPYFLLNKPADWMKGSVCHLVGARRANLDQTDFLNAAYQWASAFAKQPPKEIDAALLCCGNDYLVAWVHSATPKLDLEESLDSLAAQTMPVLRAALQAKKLEAGLWDSWTGLDLSKDTCINIQLHRPSPTVIAPRAPNSTVPIEPIEVPHLALWKSCVAEVLAREFGQGHTNACCIDLDHPIVRATDRYCRSMEHNIPLQPPVDTKDEEAVLTYLSYLHHRRAHARIAQDAVIEADIDRQTQEYKFGNPLWQQMFQQYFKYYWEYPFHEGGSPMYRSWQAADAGNGDLSYGVIDWRLPANARIAIVGDIGTGTDVAAAVLDAALKFNPDAVLHLGDVYFSGTQFETQHRLVGLVRSVMGKQRVPFFTVPGNHEYFTGGKSFFATLDSGRLVTEDVQQQAASYFCLRTADDGWQFLGLDTGYNGHYMNVPPAAQQAVLERLHIGKVKTSGENADPHWPKAFNPYFSRNGGANLPVQDPTSSPPQVTLRPDEAMWHQDKLARFAGRSILLSHHQLYSSLSQCGIAQKQSPQPDGSSKPDPTDFNRTWIDTGLWRQLGNAFGDKVVAWIWGHEHNLGIYQDNYRPADWPTDSADALQIFKTLPKGRCAGHSAIPVQQSEDPYAQKFPVPLKSPDLTLGLTNGWYNHGFQIVELAGAAKPARISYFEVSDADPVPLPIFVEQIG